MSSAIMPKEKLQIFQSRIAFRLRGRSPRVSRAAALRHIPVGISNLIISKRARAKWIGRPTTVHPAGAIARTEAAVHPHADPPPRPIRDLSYYPRIKTQIKRGRPKPKLNLSSGRDARGAARARRRRMALIDRETISIPLYVFIISRSSRRFNIETDTWDASVVIPMCRRRE